MSETMDIFEGKHPIRERLLADATHRMKNIMGGISGFAALLSKDMDKRSDDYPLVERIQENVMCLDQFLIDVMTLIRERSLHIETIDIPSTIREVCSNYYQDADDESFTLPFKIESTQPKINFNADPLLVRNGFYHALHFVELISQKIDSLRIILEKSTLQIRYDFRCEESLDCLKDDIVSGLGSLESIDARLSLAVCVKIIRLHGGEVVVDHADGKQWILLLHLRKE